jgi:uncharacterized membrane protein YdjX (TVP38/TMEM64 family)
MATPSEPGESKTPVTSWRRAVLAFVLFGGLGLVFLFGLPMLGLDGGAAARRWLSLARGPWALPAVILVFAVLAFLGAPQVALIAATVLVYGPWPGLAYSWTGTMVSSLVGFGLGRGFGARLIEDWSGARKISDLVGRNGFVASLAVRLVPFAPFVLVNIAAGVTAMSWAAFALGTGIGILPKIAVIAFAGRSLAAGGGWAWAWLAAALAVWGLAGLAAKRWLGR